MEIKIEQKEGIKIIKLSGDLDGTNAEEVQEKIIVHVDSDSRLVFNMGKCKYLSSAGLRVLLIVAKKLKALGGKGVMVNLLEEVKDVMEMTGFSHILPSCETIPEAIVYVKKEG